MATDAPRLSLAITNAKLLQAAASDRLRNAAASGGASAASWRAALARHAAGRRASAAERRRASAARLDARRLRAAAVAAAFDAAAAAAAADAAAAAAAVAAFAAARLCARRAGQHDRRPAVFGLLVAALRSNVHRVSRKKAAGQPRNGPNCQAMHEPLSGERIARQMRANVYKRLPSRVPSATANYARRRRRLRVALRGKPTAAAARFGLSTRDVFCSHRVSEPA